MPVTGSNVLAMQNFDIIDETFDRDRTATYELSIQVSLNGFSFAVKDTLRNTFIALHHLGWNGYAIENVDFRQYFKNLTTSYPWIKNDFKRVIMAIDLPIFTLIPADYFQASSAKLVLEQVHRVPDGFELGFQECKTESAYLVYAAPSQLISEWKSIQKNSILTHTLTSLLPVPYHLRDQSYMQVDLADSLALFVLHINGKLFLSNAFTCKAQTDVIYYLHGIAKSATNIDGELNINITGHGDLMPGLPDQLQRYFSKVTHQADFTRPVFFSYRLLRFRSQFFKLFNLANACE